MIFSSRYKYIFKLPDESTSRTRQADVATVSWLRLYVRIYYTTSALAQFQSTATRPSDYSFGNPAAQVVHGLQRWLPAVVNRMHGGTCCGGHRSLNETRALKSALWVSRMPFLSRCSLGASNRNEIRLEAPVILCLPRCKQLT